MISHRQIFTIICFLLLASEPIKAQKSSTLSEKRWTDSFSIESCSFTANGENLFFILKPGYRSEYIGIEGKDTTRLIITVLDATEKVGEVESRIVEERESVNGKLIEVSRNYFALCMQTNSVFYFGEAVDMYSDGKIISHEGAWRADKDGAKPGVMMPGLILLGSRFYQEIAPKIAMDRAEIVGMNETVVTPAGVFNGCLKIEETTPLEPKNKEYKFYAPGVGLVKDGNLLLVKREKVLSR